MKFRKPIVVIVYQNALRKTFQNGVLTKRRLEGRQ